MANDAPLKLSIVDLTNLISALDHFKLITFFDNADNQRKNQALPEKVTKLFDRLFHSLHEPSLESWVKDGSLDVSKQFNEFMEELTHVAFHEQNKNAQHFIQLLNSLDIRIVFNNGVFSFENLLSYFRTDPNPRGYIKSPHWSKARLVNVPSHEECLEMIKAFLEHHKEKNAKKAIAQQEFREKLAALEKIEKEQQAQKELQHQAYVAYRNEHFFDNVEFHFAHFSNILAAYCYGQSVSTAKAFSFLKVELSPKIAHLINQFNQPSNELHGAVLINALVSELILSAEQNTNLSHKNAAQHLLGFFLHHQLRLNFQGEIIQLNNYILNILENRNSAEHYPFINPQWQINQNYAGKIALTQFLVSATQQKHQQEINLQMKAQHDAQQLAQLIPAMQQLQLQLQAAQMEIAKQNNWIAQAQPLIKQYQEWVNTQAMQQINAKPASPFAPSAPSFNSGSAFQKPTPKPSWVPTKTKNFWE